MATIRCEVADSVATVTITNPAKRNAMSAAMWAALTDVLGELAADSSVRVLVLTGAGDTFCAGADISELSDLEVDGVSLAIVAEKALAEFPKPTIAAIRGYCVGGGCQLAAACDLRFAAVGTRFGVTPAKLGIVYPALATARLVELVGSAGTKYLLYSAELISAEHALRIGLIDEVMAGEQLADRVGEFAATLVSRSQLTLQATKDVIGAIVGGSLTERQMSAWRAEELRSGETAEGIAAFVERRAPRFPWVRRST
jgi:enoyl-CoA hydratase/carnithine racemase